MRLKNLSSCATIVLFMFSSHVLHAEQVLSPQMNKAWSLYKEGDYNESLKELALVRESSQMPLVWYWKGICQARLQNFDEAAASFEKSIALKGNFPDLFYEYGQALYAANKLQKARTAFSQSLEQNYMPANSLYYMGYISQTSEEEQLAIQYYKELDKRKDASKEIKQAAAFQLGEIYFLQAKKLPHPAKAMHAITLPQLSKALSIDSESALAPDINNRINEIKQAFDLIPKMKNGKIIPDKRYTLSLKESMEYDSNVVMEADTPIEKASQKSSFISKSEFNGKYTFYLVKRFTLTPDVRLTYDKYLDNTSPDIYQNNNYSMTPAIRSTFEHKYKGQNASTLVEYEYNYTDKDQQKIKELTFYSRANTFIIGERFTHFEIGETTLKYKFKSYKSYNSDLNSKTHTLSINQNVSLKSGHLLLLTNTDDFASVSDESKSTNTYLFRGDYIIPSFIYETMLTLSLGYTLTDTKSQKDTRGWERTLNPGLRIDKGLKSLFKKNISAGLRYDYTKNTSKDKSSYAYTKSVIGLELEWKF